MKKYLILGLLFLLLACNSCKKYDDGKYYIYVDDDVYCNATDIVVYKNKITFRLYDNFYEIYNPENVVIMRCD